VAEIQKAIDPHGSASFGLGTLGATIGTGIFLGRINAENMMNMKPLSASTAVTTVDGKITSTVATATAIDTASAIALGAVVGATAAVLGGLAGAVVVSLIKKPTSPKWWCVSLLGIVGAAVGAIVGLGVGFGIGSFAIRIGGHEGLIVGLVTGGIAGLLDSIAF
jgi:hypothetical protein